MEVFTFHKKRTRFACSWMWRWKSFHIYLLFLSNISLCATNSLLWCFERWKLSTYSFLVMKSYRTMPSLTFEKTLLFPCFAPAWNLQFRFAQKSLYNQSLVHLEAFGNIILIWTLEAIQNFQPREGALFFKNLIFLKRLFQGWITLSTG